MSLEVTRRAIGEVSELLRLQLNERTNLNVTVGRPHAPSVDNPRLNVFLFEAEFDPSLKNAPLDEGQAPPLWLVLRFLITAFDEVGRSDTVGAHRNLGIGLRALQELSYLPVSGLPTDGVAALEDNPERLKISFVQASSELLSKLIQGADEPYLFSMAFELRPVMIVAVEPTDYSLLVGIDYTQPPPDDRIGEDGIVIDVAASMGICLTGVIPPAATAGDTLTVSGESLVMDGVVARLGPVELPVAAGANGGVEIALDPAVVNGENISAGQHPLVLAQTLVSGRVRASNLVVFELLPTVTSVSPGTLVSADGNGETSLLRGTFEVEGTFLGGETDDVFVALYADGATVGLFDDVAAVADSAVQTETIVTIPEEQAVPEGTYRVIVRVNGSQARQSPELTLSAP